MPTVVKRTASSATTTTASSNNARRPSTRALEAAATEAMSLTIEASTGSQDGQTLTPPPMSARSELALRLSEVSMNSPVSERRGSPAAAATAAATSHNSGAGAVNGTTSLFAQNRAMLLSGLPKGASPQPSASSSAMHGIQRRNSGNGPLMANPNRRLTPLVTVTDSATQPHRHPLSAHPHLGSAGSPSALSPRTISPCVYVRAVGLRRPSTVSVADDAKDVKTEKTDKTGRKTSSASSTKSTDSLLSTPPPETRLVVSARITPANTEKQPFTLQREFDLHELVEALPRPDHRRPSTVNILESPTVHSPRTTPFQSPNTPVGTSTSTSTSPAIGRKRSAPDSTPVSPHPTVRRQTRRSNQQQHHQQLTPVKELPSPGQFVANGRIPIPIRPHPSLGCLPGLAAIILSRRVEAGDTIEIPMPYPEAWPMTVAYAYKSTGEAAATNEVKANLEHLGGKVTEE